MVSTNLDKSSCIPRQNAGVPIQEDNCYTSSSGIFSLFSFQAGSQFSHITQEMKSD